MKKLVVGILAHVDAGKTTLSEALLYHCGAIRRLGRVDHRDAFLDTDQLERERGITIFSKQAIFRTDQLECTLLDTPGHSDFSAEMERTLQVLDCAILVISGTDGVQSHTHTLWRLLQRRRIPTLIFVNKMDLPTRGQDALMEQLRRELSENCVDFSRMDAAMEACAMCKEELLSEFLDTGSLRPEHVAGAVAGREIFPCWFGSALRLRGIEPLLDGMAAFIPQPEYPEEFAARVYKIARDGQGNRLTFLKVLGGSLRVRQPVSYGETEEKIHQIRLYSGEKFTSVETAAAGMVCAVTGLTKTQPGQGLGAAASAEEPYLQPALTYQIILNDGMDPAVAMQKLRQLAEEDPQLHLVWNEQLQQIHIQLMGEVQMEVLQRVIAERLGMSVSFGEGNVVYRETIAAPVIGIGHFEPLRHYAEVHLLLEPGERGSGIQLASACPTDQLALNWQRLILTHLAERNHPGVLTGSPVTDMKITLLAGRAHPKHTEGGDFRQATYRAVRQGLRSAQCILLEPYYSFRLEIPQSCVGRAMTDLERRNADLRPWKAEGDRAIMCGTAPVAAMRGYLTEVNAYTKGRGNLSCTVQGYAPCRDQEQVVERIGYVCDRDILNPADSVFCSHGAGYLVPWNEVPRHAHVGSGLRLSPDGQPAEPAVIRRSVGAQSTAEEERELQAIFERTYGAIRRTDFLPRRQEQVGNTQQMLERMEPQESFLLVDGYNIIFAWDELKAIAQEDLEHAREVLIRILCNYQGYRGGNLILVFDAYKVSGGKEKIEKHNGIYVVYTREAQLADNYIERVTNQLGRRYQIRVATSDSLEQIITLAHGAMRLSAAAFYQEVLETDREIAKFLEREVRRGTK